jgi:hypothetical protein
MLMLLLLLANPAAAHSLRGGPVFLTQDSGGELITGAVQYDGNAFTLFGVPVSFQGGVLVLKNSTGTIQPSFDAGLAPKIRLSEALELDVQLGLLFLPFAGGSEVDFVGHLIQTAPYLGGGIRFAPFILSYRRLVVSDSWHEVRLSYEVSL